MSQEKLPARIGKYQIIRKAGRGGFGDVYEGWDSALGRNVAIKVLKPRDEEDRRRFEREARVIAALGPQLPVVAQIFDFISDRKRDLHYLVEEFLSGVDLKTKIEEGDRLPAEVRLAYLDKVAYGLAEVHKRGVVHRDLKPGNVRVLHNHEIKLLDFGLAKVVGEETLALKEGGVGTPSYAAPEQSLDVGRLGSDAVDARADIFSFGVISYELLTVRRPFEAQNWKAYFELLGRSSPEPIRAFWPQCPDDLEQLLLACLERDPGLRPTLEEVRAVLKTSIRQSRALAIPPVAPGRRVDTTAPTVRGKRMDEVVDEAESVASDDGPLDDRTPDDRRPQRGTLLDDDLGAQVVARPLPEGTAGNASGEEDLPWWKRAAVRRWLLPAFVVGLVVGGMAGLGGGVLVGERADEETGVGNATEGADDVAASPAAAGGGRVEARPDATFELEPRLERSPRGPAVELRGTPPLAGAGADAVAYCRIERAPPWRLGDTDQAVRRRDDCWLVGAGAGVSGSAVPGQVVYEDADVEPGVSYVYEIRLVDGEGDVLGVGLAEAEVPAAATAAPAESDG